MNCTIRQKLLAMLVSAATLFGISSSAADLPRLIVPRISAPIEIDGSGMDAGWQNLPWHSGFTLLDRASAKPGCTTRFKIAHDNHKLYFLVECSDPPSGGVEPRVTVRDGKVFNDDCVEFFIDPNYDRDRFYHIAINRANAVYDAELTQGGIIRYAPWNAEKLESAVGSLDRKWLLELAVPLVELGLEQDSGRMGINIVRSLPKNAAMEYSSFVPITGNLAQPAKFAVAQLEDAALEHFAWKLRSPYDIKLVRRNGKLYYEGKLHLENATGKLRFATMEQRIDHGGSATVNVFMDSGVGSEYSFSLPCDPAAATGFTVTVTDRRGGGRMLLRHFPLDIRYSPMTVTLTNPPYRDNIYADMKITALEGTVVVHDADCATQPVSLHLTGANGKVIAETRLNNPGAFSLPVSELPDGIYTLTAQAGECRCTKTIRKLPKHRGEVRFDARHNMYVDGRPFLPYGWFSYTNLADAQKAGYSVEIYYNGAFLHGEKLQKHVDERFKYGIRTIIYCYPSNKIYSKSAMQKPLSRAEAELIRSRVRELRDHPGLLGWYIGDELESAPALPSRIREICEICREEDPYHPTVILNNTAGGYLKYADCADILLPDIYPNFLVGGDAGKPIRCIADMLEIARNSGNRILWVTPQGFNYGDFGRIGQRAPNFTELRNMQYQALISGAKGFVWYVYNGSECYPELIGGIASLHKELAVLKDLWYDGKYRKLPSASPDVLLYECTAKGRRYLIAVNTATQPRSFALPVGGRTFYTAGEEDTFTVRDGKLHDTLAKYQVKVYVSDASLARSFRVTDSKLVIEKTAAALHKKGNLAYWPVSGVKIALNFKPRGRNPLVWHLADGSNSRPLIPLQGQKVKPAVTMTFPREIRAGRALLYGRKLKRAVVEIERGGKWIKVAETGSATAIPDAHETQMTVVEAKWQPETFRKIRFAELEMGGIGEIELYEGN